MAKKAGKRAKGKATKRARPAGKGRKAARGGRAGRSGEATADRILEAAYELFVRRRGFHENTIEDVARRARVAKGTVYLYHRSKEDLLFDAVEREMEGLRREFFEPMRAAGDPAARLRGLADFRRWANPRFDTLNEAILTLLAHPVSSVRRRVRRLIRRAQAQERDALAALFTAAAGGRSWRGSSTKALALAYAIALRGLVFETREGLVEDARVAHAAAHALAKLLVPGKDK